MEAIEAISLMLGVAWASGINLYAAILVLGWLGATGDANLPPDLQVLSSPGVMATAGIMYSIEFFTDKVPGVDTGWDLIHTFIRIPAGAMLAASAAQGLDMGQSAELIGLLAGGGLAATTHTTKMGSRAIINTSPEPFSNWIASFTEDVSVVVGLWAALHYPILFLIMLAVFIALAIWLLPKIWRALRRIIRAIGNWFRERDEDNKADEVKSTPEKKNLLQSMYSDASNEPK